MEWPLKTPAVPDKQTDTWSLYYLAVCKAPSDPTIVWGSDVPMDGLDAYIKRVNATSDVLVSPAHVLVWAVGRALAKHPHFNRRVLRRRLFDFKQANVLMPVLGGKNGPEVCLLTEVDRKSLGEIAGELWGHARELAQGSSTTQRDEWIFRVIPSWLNRFALRVVIGGGNIINWPAALWGHRLLRAGTMINYFGHRGAPPMRSFKPSRFPNDALTTNVTMGPTEAGPTGRVAPLFVRIDHRLGDAYQLGQFVADLRRFLMQPELLDAPSA